MRKLRIIYALFALLAVSCGRDELVENEVRRPVVPGKQSSVIIEGEDGDGRGATTRASFSPGALPARRPSSRLWPRSRARALTCGSLRRWTP